MSNATNGASLVTEDAASVRQRHYQNVTRLLKEYTVVMYEIAHQIVNYRDTARNQPKSKLPGSVFLAVWRYRSVWEAMRDVALFASQMLVHYQLDEAEAAELRLRVVDAENGIELTGHLINALREDHPATGLGEPIPSAGLDRFVEQLQAALK
jgi:hypothetical protein